MEIYPVLDVLMSLKRVARIKIFFDVFGAIKIGINFDRACSCFSPFLSIPVEQKITGFLYSLKNLILLFNCFELEKSIIKSVFSDRSFLNTSPFFLLK